ERRAVGGHHDDDGAGLALQRAHGQAAAGDDGRGDALRQGAADRRRQGEGAGSAPRGYRDGSAAGAQSQRPDGRPAGGDSQGDAFRVRGRCPSGAGVGPGTERGSAACEESGGRQRGTAGPGRQKAASRAHRGDRPDSPAADPLAAQLVRKEEEPSRISGWLLSTRKAVSSDRRRDRIGQDASREAMAAGSGRRACGFVHRRLPTPVSLLSAYLLNPTLCARLPPCSFRPQDVPGQALSKFLLARFRILPESRSILNSRSAEVREDGTLTGRESSSEKSAAEKISNIG